MLPETVPLIVSLNQLLFNHLVNDRHPIKQRWFLLGFLLCILTVQKLWDFTFLRGLAPDLLDGFSMGRCEEKRESFDLFAGSEV